MRAHNKQLLKKERATENKQSYGAVTVPRGSAQLQINKICLTEMFTTILQSRASVFSPCQRIF